MLYNMVLYSKNKADICCLLSFTVAFLWGVPFSRKHDIHLITSKSWSLPLGNHSMIWCRTRNTGWICLNAVSDISNNQRMWRPSYLSRTWDASEGHSSPSAACESAEAVSSLPGTGLLPCPLLVPSNFEYSNGFVIVVLICVSLMTNDIEHIFMCFLVSIYSFDEVSAETLRPFFIGFFVYYWILSSLHFTGKSPVWYANIFSQPMA